MKPYLKSLMQIGIIVRNLEEAVKNYEAMGIGPWDIAAINNAQPPFEDLTFDGKELEERGDIIKTAMIQAYGMEIELIEPVAKETAYYKWLEEHGPGIHHLAFDVDGAYEDFLTGCREKNGKEPWVRGQAIGGLMDFAYVDLREETGLIIECYRKLQKGKPYLRYDREKEEV